MEPVRRLAWLLFLLFIAGILFVGYVHAEPIAIASDDKVTVVLYDEPCALPAVSNLQNRATWKDERKSYEGCWGTNGQIVLFYFDDRSVVGVVVQAFQRINAL